MSELIRVFETGILPIIQEYVRWQIYRGITHEVIGLIAIICVATLGVMAVRYIWKSTNDDLRINRRDR